VSARLAFGIDLGTTNSLLAHGSAGEVSVLDLGEDGRLLSSCVHVGEKGAISVGKQARMLGLKEPARFFEHFKRDMGDPHWRRDVGGLALTPVVLSSFVLRRLVQEAEKKLGPVREAVITVPAWFGDLERGATLDAARIAGIERARALNEPTAAALAYGLDPSTWLKKGPGSRSEKRRALVYDLGGGTFDVTVVELDGGRVKVLATAGERKLGGKDWDDELVNMISERVYERVSIDPRENELALALMRRHAERAKILLSTQKSATIKLELQGTHEVVVTRDELEQRTRGLVEQTETQLELVLEKARLRWSEIDAVLPVGGATRMPVIQATLRRVAGREPLSMLNPDEAVARGACTYAALLARGGSLEIEMVSGGRASESSVGGARESSVSAARTSGIILDENGEELPLLPGAHRVPEVQDVVSHGLGVVVVNKSGRKNVVLIPEQTPVPVKRTRPFFTIKDGQTAVRIEVLEGDGEDPLGCTRLGELVVDDLPPGRPKGQEIRVSYEYDEDGRVQVAAVDVDTGKAAHATIERVGALEKSEISALRTEVARRLGPGISS
jgi:molecular chaperone DnaK